MDAPAENTPDVQEDPCAASYDDSRHGLRIASIFIILVSVAPDRMKPEAQERYAKFSWPDVHTHVFVACVIAAHFGPLVHLLQVTSIIGTLAPVLLRRTKSVFAHPLVFDFCKFFGSGVIIATAFMQ